MPRMIPSTARAGANGSERKLFDAFAGIVGHDDWVVYHSLPIRRHVSKLMGEADFVVAVPGRGVVVIEAKAPQSVTYRDGEWYLERVPDPQKNPFKQVDGAVGSIRSYLMREGAITGKEPFARLVWFTSLGRFHFDGRAPADLSFFEWELAWADDIARPTEKILHVLDEFCAWYSRAAEVEVEPSALTPERVEAITKALTRDFSFFADEQDAKREAQEREVAILAEQRFALEIVEGNRAVYFDGPAGTGKSYLAVQAAIESAKRGTRTLLTCWNVEMASRLRAAASVVHGPIVVRDLGSLMVHVAGLDGEAHREDNTWYQEELPRLALAGLRDHPAYSGYRAIVVDEFQDVAGSARILDVIEALADQNATFVFAGDARQQVMRRNAERVNPYAVMKSRMPDLVLARIRRNCRQSPKLARMNQDILGTRCGFTGYRLPGNTPGSAQVLRIPEQQEVEVLAGSLRMLMEKYGGDGVAVLSPWGSRSLVSRIVAGEIDSPGASADLRWIKANVGKGKGQSTYGSIAGLKGIEADAVIVTDVSDGARAWAESHDLVWNDLLYVALSCAKYRAVVLESVEEIGSAAAAA